MDYKGNKAAKKQISTTCITALYQTKKKANLKNKKPETKGTKRSTPSFANETPYICQTKHMLKLDPCNGIVRITLNDHFIKMRIRYTASRSTSRIAKTSASLECLILMLLENIIIHHTHTPQKKKTHPPTQTNI